VVTRLTAVIARPGTGDRLLALAERVADELGGAREASRGLRGEARERFLQRLEAIDREFLQVAREETPAQLRSEVTQEAEAQLSAFRGRMPEAAWTTAVEAACDNLLRERLGLPLVIYRP
jgi:vacuolar-type H+-ATPase subunit H